jgi:hypothetical protein
MHTPDGEAAPSWSPPVEHEGLLELVFVVDDPQFIEWRPVRWNLDIESERLVAQARSLTWTVLVQPAAAGHIGAEPALFLLQEHISDEAYNLTWLQHDLRTAAHYLPSSTIGDIRNKSEPESGRQASGESTCLPVPMRRDQRAAWTLPAGGVLTAQQASLRRIPKTDRVPQHAVQALLAQLDKVCLGIICGRDIRNCH